MANSILLQNDYKIKKNTKCYKPKKACQCQMFVENEILITKYSSRPNKNFGAFFYIFILEIP